MKKLLAAVAVVGPFKADDAEYNTEKYVQTILQDAHKFSEEKYGKGNYYWVTSSIQLGFCRYVLNFCRKQDIKLISIDTIPMHFPGPAKIRNEHIKVPFGSEDDMRAIFKCKHAAILELADHFFIKVAYKMTNIDDLVERVKRSNKPFIIFNEENMAIEYRGDPTNSAKKEKTKV